VGWVYILPYRGPQVIADFFMATNTQTIYKQMKNYHDMHVAELLEKGYKIIEETREYTKIESSRDTTSQVESQPTGG